MIGVKYPHTPAFRRTRPPARGGVDRVLWIAAVKEEPAKEERLLRRRENPRIERAISILKTGDIPLDVLLKQIYPDMIDNVDFWWAFLDDKRDIPLSA